MKTVALRCSIVLGAALFAAAPLAVNASISQANQTMRVADLRVTVGSSTSSHAGLVP